MMNLDPRTVTRYAAGDLGGLIASARDRRRSPIDPFKAFLQERFRASCHNGRQLHREIVERGYPGSHQAVRRYVATLRSGTADPEERRDVPSPRQITGWIMHAEGTLTDDKRQRLRQALEACPDLAVARELADAFHLILRQRSGHADLTGWTQRAGDRIAPAPGLRGVPAERLGRRRRRTLPALELRRGRRARHAREADQEKVLRPRLIRAPTHPRARLDPVTSTGDPRPRRRPAGMCPSRACAACHAPPRRGHYARRDLGNSAGLSNTPPDLIGIGVSAGGLSSQF